MTSFPFEERKKHWKLRQVKYEFLKEGTVRKSISLQGKPILQSTNQICPALQLSVLLVFYPYLLMSDVQEYLIQLI